MAKADTARERERTGPEHPLRTATETDTWIWSKVVDVACGGQRPLLAVSGENYRGDAQDDVLVNLTVTDRQSTGGPTNSIESELVVK